MALRWDGDQIRMACPVHKGDNKTSFAWSHQYLTWKCFSHDCHEANGNNALGFIMSMEDCTKEEACEIATKIVEENQGIIIERRQQVRTDRKRITHKTQKQLTDINCKQVMLSTYANSRGILKSIQKRYFVGTYGAIGVNRFSVPIFDIDKKLVGLSSRKILDSDTGPKWLHLPIGFKSSVNLYNVHAVKPQKGVVILVEGPMDVLRFESARIQNSLAALGSSVSADQAALLGELNVTEVILAFDNDQAGEKGAKKSAKFLRNYGYSVSRMRWHTRYNDIGEIPIRCLRRHEWIITDI
jgi:5S rRNA maturation endonuclease (ribonuclease M5)